MDNEDDNNSQQTKKGSTVVNCEIPLGGQHQQQKEVDDKKERATKGGDDGKSSSTTTSSIKKSHSSSPFEIFRFMIFLITCPFRVLFGSIAFLYGFCCNTILERFRSEGDKKRESWDETNAAVTEFLNESGIMEEIQQGWNNRFVQNARIANVIERHVYPKGRIDATRIQGSKGESNPHIATNDVDTVKAFRIMKYATSAYGQQVIANAVFESGERFPPLPTDPTRDAVMKHIDVPNLDDNIVVMKLEYGEKLKYLRHYCVIDHKNKSIVLAIRGTYSVSSTMVDVAGYCEEFHGGMAHSGIAQMAKGVWDESGSQIIQAIENNPEYEFVVCGHSLGAGVAGLLNIMFHDQPDLLPEETKIQCYLYAGPPTFSTLYADSNHERMLRAVQNTKCFIFRHDTVPFISVDAIRKYMIILGAIDKLKIPCWEAFLIDHEFLLPTQKMIQTYKDAVSVTCQRQSENNDDDGVLPKIDKAPQLYQPASQIIWIDKEPNHCCFRCGRDQYRLTYCDTQKVADLTPHLATPSGIADHLTGRYEYSLRYSNKQ